jgi:ribonuclease J
MPIYSLPMTLGLIEEKLDEFGIDGDLRAIAPRQVVTAGCFEVEAFHVTHSTVDSVGFAITSPIGTVVHSGDFKFDPTPVDGRETDMARLKEIGDRGVLLLLSDSTNVLVSGHCPSERSVGPTIAGIVAEAPGRVIVTTFSSHIFRMQQVIDLAQAAGRPTGFIGRSMIRNAEVAERLGYIRRPRDPVTATQGHKSVLLVTGSQGEPRSALVRAAAGENRKLELGGTDTVIISARIIPGNELPIQRLIDNVCRRGATVFAHEVPAIHASGHGYAEELKQLIEVLRPRYFVPAHGNLHMLVKHADLAVESGIARENVVVTTNGSPVELDGQSLRASSEPVPHGKVFIDSESEEVPYLVVRDRQHLADEGFVIIVAAMSSDGRLLREVEIITRGVLHVDVNQHILDELRGLATSIIDDSPLDERLDRDLLQDTIRSAVKRYFRKKFGRRPLILPVVWEM